MGIEDKLAALSIVLPPPYKYHASRRGCVQSGNLLYVSGHPPAALEGVPTSGKVDADVSEDDAYRVARAVAVNMLSSMKQELGDLDRVKQVLKLLGMVNCTPGFNRPSGVINGASDLFLELWGPEYGQHTRSAGGDRRADRRHSRRDRGYLRAPRVGSAVTARPRPVALVRGLGTT